MGATHNRCVKSFNILAFLSVYRSNNYLDPLMILSQGTHWQLRCPKSCSTRKPDAKMGDLVWQCTQFAHASDRDLAFGHPLDWDAIDEIGHRLASLL